MFRSAAFVFALAALATLTPAQRPLAEIQAGFQADREALMQEKRGRITFQDAKALGGKHARILEEWLPTATGTDAINGRLMLANILADTGEEDRARQVLRALDVERAPALELAAAAEMAGNLGLADERAAWIDAAVGKQAPFDERMALALFLMTRLVEVQKGEAIFDAALDVAADDEGRAKVLWYRAAALREREDLAEGAYEGALDELAKAYPDTLWGGIARDRRRAFDLDVGVDAIGFEAQTLAGEPVKLADFAGTVVLLDFWSDRLQRGQSVHPELAKMLAEYGEKGFSILGIAMDEDRATVEAAMKARGTTWPQVFDGRGLMTSVALRYGIEQVPDHVLVGRDGKIAGMRIYLMDDVGVRELRDAIERALRAK